MPDNNKFLSIHGKYKPIQFVFMRLASHHYKTLQRKHSTVLITAPHQHSYTLKMTKTSQPLLFGRHCSQLNPIGLTESYNDKVAARALLCSTT
jgi:hypothetical protein